METGPTKTLPTQPVTVSPHANTVLAGEMSPPAVDRLVRGVLVGRYIVIDLVGSGGMGAVYAAYDPELNRKVALKLLLPGSSPDRTRQPQLLREAQMMAQLSHPNICAIHDVGTFHEQLFFAMEFVAGVTLRAWLKQRAHGWRDIMEVLLPVGRGIAAAHAVGIVHGDLKPENVMIGADGRPRVMDFGIARAHRTEENLVTNSEPSAHPDESRTAPSSIRGTPQYMAPELWNSASDALSDQFAFCVMAWEALYGERPFPAELTASVTDVKRLHPRPAPPSAQVPSWARRILLRGLSGRREERFPTMGALLTALASGQARRRRSWFVIGATVLGLAWGGVAGGRAWQEQRRVAACEAAGASLGADVWSDEARARVKNGLVSSGIPDPDQATERVGGWIDTFVARWQQVRTEACLAGDARPLVCLADQRERLGLLVATLAEEKGPVASKAIRAVAALPDPRVCADPALTRLPQPIEQLDAQALVASLRQDLRRGQVLEVTGRGPEARALVDSVVGRADAAGLHSLAIEARQVAGSMAELAGDSSVAEVLLRNAMVEAGAAALDDIAADAAIMLTLVVGKSLGRHVEALRIGEVAEMFVRRIGQVDRPRHARLLAHMAWARHMSGELREALALEERAVEILRRELGEAHPDLVLATDHLASLRRDQGQYAEALKEYASALTLAETLLGPDSPDAAITLSNMGFLHSFLGDHEQALAMQRRALAIFERNFGPAHPDVARARANLANALAMGGDVAGSLAEHQRAIAGAEAALGINHRDLPPMLHDLAFAQAILGDFAEAEQNLRRALRIWEAALGADDARIGALLAALGDLMVKAGRPADAVPLLERSVRIAEAQGAQRERVADARVSLARAVWAARGDREAALAIAEEAAAAYRAAGAVRANFLAELESWMREVSARPAPRRVEGEPRAR